MYPMQFMLIFSCASSVQQPIIPEWPNQIILLHIVGKRRYLALQLCVIQANLSLVSNFKGQATNVAQTVREKVRSESMLYLQVVLIDKC